MPLQENALPDDSVELQAIVRKLSAVRLPCTFYLVFFNQVTRAT